MGGQVASNRNPRKALRELRAIWSRPDCNNTQARTYVRKMLAPRASIISVLDSRTLCRTGRRRSTRHRLLHAERRRRDSAWLLTTSIPCSTWTTCLPPSAGKALTGLGAITSHFLPPYKGHFTSHRSPA